MPAYLRGSPCSLFGRATTVAVAALISLVSPTAPSQEMGGGEYQNAVEDCISELDKQFMRAGFEDYERRFGPLSQGSKGVAPARYTFYPMGGTLFRDVFINNFVDLDPGPDILIFDCIEWSINGHDAHDIDLRSFEEQIIGVPIFAVSDGRVVMTHDGEEDMNTSLEGQAANFVVIDHGGGRRGNYWHMRKGSVVVSPGQFVSAGQQIGFVASSGNSTGPHLHFSTYDSGVVVEPNAGDCNPIESLWVNQVPLPTEVILRDFGITDQSLAENVQSDKLPTNVQIPTSAPSIRIWFRLGALPANSDLQIEFVDPNGSSLGEVSVSFNNDFFVRAGWWWYTFNNPSGILGTWTINFSINDQLMASPQYQRVDSVNPEFNRAPEAIGVSFEPAAPKVEDVVVCRIDTSTVLDDLDFDVVSYEYVWEADDVEVRRIVSAAHSDAIPHHTAATGQRLTCSVTPSDGIEDGPTAQVSVVVGVFDGDLSITVDDGEDLVDQSQEIIYTIVASNNGSSDVTDALVVDNFPAKLNAVTWQCTGVGGATCESSGIGDIVELVDLPAGSSVTFTATATISSTARGTIENTATIEGPPGFTDTTPGDNSATDIDTLPINEPPEITAQIPLRIQTNFSLTITLEMLFVDDVDNNFPDDFSLAVATGEDYTRAGNTITPTLDFEGDLVVPVTVNDGELDSDVFNLSVTVTSENTAPSDITLSSNTVRERLPVGRRVAILSTEDDDLYATHTYAFVSGAGSEHNALFVIDGDTLITAQIFDQNTPRALNFRIQTTDNIGESFTKGLILNIDETFVALCERIDQIKAQLESFRDEFGILSGDHDADGLPESAALTLLGRIACENDASERWAAVINAFDINLAAIASEQDLDAITDFGDLIAALMMISEDTQDALREPLSGQGVNLTSDYAIASCLFSEDCNPTSDEVLAKASIKTLREPLSGGGDPDADLLDNATEYLNILAAGGDDEDFATAALDRALDGTTIPNGCSASLGTRGAPDQATGDIAIIALAMSLLLYRARRRRHR